MQLVAKVSLIFYLWLYLESENNTFLRFTVVKAVAIFEEGKIVLFTFPKFVVISYRKQKFQLYIYCTGGLTEWILILWGKVPLKKGILSKNAEKEAF